jgi:hypothetical protein
VKPREVRDRRDVESRAGHVANLGSFPPPPAPPLARVVFQVDLINQSISSDQDDVNVRNQAAQYDEI